MGHGQFGGQHYVLHGESVERVSASPDELPSGMAEAFRFGYGFSLAYTRAAALRLPFPVEGTEDIAFVKGLLAAGAPVQFVSDRPDLAIHVTHAGSDTGVYPQRFIKRIGKQSPVGQELPRGQTIHVEPNVVYTVLARIAQKHSLRSIATRAGSWGVRILSAQDDVSPAVYGVEVPPSGYRLVLVRASSASAADLPWEAPRILRGFDKSSVVRAWKEDGVVGVSGLPGGRLPPKVIARVPA